MTDPFQNTKDWHIYAMVALMIFGSISIIYLVAKGIIWIVNHIQFAN